MGNSDSPEPDRRLAEIVGHPGGIPELAKHRYTDLIDTQIRADRQISATQIIVDTRIAQIQRSQQIYPIYTRSLDTDQSIDT